MSKSFFSIPASRALITVLFGSLSMWSIAQISRDSAQVRFDEIYAIELSDPEEAIELYQNTILDLDSEIDIGRAHSYIGMVHLAQGAYDSLELYMDRALTIFESTDYQRGIASVYNTLANANLYRGYYTQALAQYQQALPYYEKPGQEYNLTIILNNMASMFQHNEDQKTSLAYLERALEISKQLEDEKALANSYNNISAAYIQLEDYSRGYHYSDSAVTHIRKTEDQKLSSLMISNLARASINIKSLDKAKSLLSELTTMNAGLNDVELSIALENTYALYYLATDAYSKSIYHGQNALEQLEIFEDQRYKEEVLSTLYKAASAQKNTALALSYYQQMDTVKSNSFLANRNRQVAELEAIYQNTQKERQINEQQLQLEKQRSSKNTLIAIGIIASLLGLFGWSIMNRRKEKAEAALLLQTEKVKSLEQEKRLNALDYILQGQESERKRIAQDLHDGLGGLLTSVRRKVGNLQLSIDDLSKTDTVKEAEKLIENACDEVRRISHDMMPATLGSLGLEDAIEDLAADAIPPHISFQLEYNTEGAIIAEIVQVNLYRIIQEIITNTIKHAKATEIYVNLTTKDNVLMTHINDNGKGFDFEKYRRINTGLGLKGILMRTSLLKGEITHSSDGGSKYQISIPLV